MEPLPVTEAEAEAGREDAPNAVAPTVESDELVADELLVEDVSIDGMCGVY